MHYIASIIPLTEPTMDKYTIAELRNLDAQTKITPISTFYLPPKELLKPHVEVAAMLGILKAGSDIMPAHHLSVKLTEPDRITENAYHEFDAAAIAQIQSHVTPAPYRALSISPAMEDLMTILALDPMALTAYKDKPGTRC